MATTRLFREFFKSEKAGGLLLIGCTILSIGLANSPLSDGYQQFWNTQCLHHTLTEWINDALMAVFFLLIGLELEREIYIGELSTIKKAMLPAVSALGGVIFPALIYFMFNRGTRTVSGTGIPMATDIAFAVGILSLMGKRVPVALRVFLTALAVIDDLFAILVIAIFYTATISFTWLFLSLLVFALLLILNRFKVHHSLPYLLGGILMWFFMFRSGVHATIAGVLLAFAIPFGNGGKKTLSYRLQHVLHQPVAFFILPLFALANTAIMLSTDWTAALWSAEGMGILLGLSIGKPIGIYLLSRLAVALKVCQLPNGISWKYLLGAGLLAGIGFTMSIFITLLAFEDQLHRSNGKIAIIAASLLAAVLGINYMLAVFRNKEISQNEKPEMSIDKV